MLKIYITIIILITLSLNYSAQTLQKKSTSQSVSKKIADQLINDRLYELWKGVPMEWNGEGEVIGRTDRDIKFAFNRDFSFDEKVRKDNAMFGLSQRLDSCGRSAAKKHSITIMYSGTWEVKKDTICLSYMLRMVYENSVDFSNSFYDYWNYSDGSKNFKCEKALLCTSEYKENRYFTLKDGKLCEAIKNGDCYK